MYFVCSSCLHGGTCVDGVNSIHCQCASGFRGSNCQHRIHPCDVNPCLNDGVCDNDADSFRCHCPFGFAGQRCESFIDWCHWKRPCANGATCHQVANEFHCTCAAGWTGPTCDVRMWSCNDTALHKGWCLRWWFVSRAETL